LNANALDTAVHSRDVQLLLETAQKITFNHGDYDKHTCLATVSQKDYSAPLAWHDYVCYFIIVVNNTKSIAL
jgi:hypothetical protein